MTTIIDGTAGITFPDTSVQAVSATNASNISSGTLGKARLPTGSVLQVVQTIYSTAFTTTSTSYVSANLTTSITPTSTSSKILCMARYQIGGGSAYWAYVTVLRNGTTDLGGLGSGSNVTGSYFSNVPDNHVSASYMILDSPSTTSSTSYTLYAKSMNGNAVRVHTDNMPSTMLLMEIAG